MGNFCGRGSRMTHLKKLTSEPEGRCVLTQAEALKRAQRAERREAPCWRP
jgi:hypothetical protein